MYFDFTRSKLLCREGVWRRLSAYVAADARGEADFPPLIKLKQILDPRKPCSHNEGRGSNETQSKGPRQ